MNKKLLFGLCLLFFAVLGNAQTIYYVNASDGSNTASGKSTEPWKTVAYAITNAAAGSTIEITGIFKENDLSLDKNLTLKGSDNGATFDGSAKTILSKLFQITKNSNITLENITFQYYNNAGTTTVNNGSVINSDVPTPTNVLTLAIKKCKFLYNKANNGGSIYIAGNLNTTIEDCLFENNTAEHFDGKVVVYGGGAICSNASGYKANLNINRCLFNKNIANGTSGAAISYNGFRDKADEELGFNLTLFKVNNSTFAYNKLTFKDGRLGQGSLWINDSGIYNAVEIENNTIAYNTTEQTKASLNGCSGIFIHRVIYNSPTTSSDYFKINNNIFFANIDAQPTPVSSSILHGTATTTKFFTISEARNNITDSKLYSWEVNTSINSENKSEVTSTQLGLSTELANNDEGLTKTLKISNNSIAVDAGYSNTNRDYIVDSNVNLDQTRKLRNLIVDVGAYEKPTTSLYPETPETIAK